VAYGPPPVTCRPLMSRPCTPPEEIAGIANFPLACLHGLCCHTKCIARFFHRENTSKMNLRNLLTAFILTFASLGILGRTDQQIVVASCALAPSVSRGLATAPVVFVGKVVTTKNRSRTAVVRVQDIWRGSHVPKIATLNKEYREHCRSFRKGVTYLFLPEPLSRVSPYWDDACTATRWYSRALAKYRPKNAHHP